MDLNAIERMLENIPKLLSQEYNDNLNKEVTKEEIWEVDKSMNPNKALGPNGFSTHFYQKCWYLIKHDLTRMVQYVHRSGKIGGSTNSTFLALIPKESNPSSFAIFRPISLCNFSYEIISKIIANQIKPLLHILISPNQGGFVEN
jgi:hypothetical protein